MTETPDIAALADAAADYIAEHGLAKSTFGEPGAPCCLMGALGVASGTHPAYGDASPVVPYVVAELDKRGYALNRGSSFFGLPGWNDDEDRTPEEVIELLRSIAADERARQLVNA